MEIKKKVWGWELILVSNELYSCKIMVLKKGYQCSIHHHEMKDETFVLLSGDVLLMCGKRDDEPGMELFKPYRICPGTAHRFAGYSPYSFLLEVATADREYDSYRETESGPIVAKWTEKEIIEREG